MLPNPGQDAVPFTTLTAQFYDETIENIEALAAGTGLNDDAITASKIDWASTGANGGIWGEEIGRTVLSVAGDTISITGLPARKYISIRLTLIASGAISPVIRFNNDSGTNYSQSHLYNNSGSPALADAVSQSSIPVTIGTIITGGVVEAELHISNTSTNNKMLTGSSSYDVGTLNATTRTAPTWLSAKYNSSAQINRVDILNLGAGDFGIGSEVIVLGHN